MLPSLFLAHGSPMIALENNPYTQFLRAYGQQHHPRAILIFTAHWISDTLTISAVDEQYKTIYDFYGFPPELYEIQYPAKGSSQIAKMVRQRFMKENIPVLLDHQRGLDHGSWTLLHHLYPEANIPVIQISVNPSLSPKEQFRIGQALQGLHEEGFLIIGSGVTVHNLSMLKWGETTPEPWAVQFDDWLIEQINKKDLEALDRYEQLAPSAQLAVPTTEHFIPLFIAMGSANIKAKPTILHRSYDMGTLSYLSFQF